MLSLSVALIVGVLIGWQFPQPSWAKAATAWIWAKAKAGVDAIEAKVKGTTTPPK